MPDLRRARLARRVDGGRKKVEVLHHEVADVAHRESVRLHPYLHAQAIGVSPIARDQVDAPCRHLARPLRLAVEQSERAFQIVCRTEIGTPVVVGSKSVESNRHDSIRAAYRRHLPAVALAVVEARLSRSCAAQKGCASAGSARSFCVQRCVPRRGFVLGRVRALCRVTMPAKEYQ
eukprot:3519748-Prymnesium_polylepis.2